MLRFLILVVSLPLGAADWIALFDGKSLTGWRVEGKADWSIQRGVLVGRQGKGGAAGDLYTERQWADFEMEVEYMVKWPANTGFWFRRSASQPGYQADILDEPRYPDALSGSLYAMGTGFIAKVADRSAIKKDGWNKMRIRAVGQQIEIWLNGRLMIKTTDQRFLKPGSIGIQVHAGKNYEGMEIRVRKMRLRPL